MYFLNGDRIYIIPQNTDETLKEQFQDCLVQLKRINSGKKIFKLNFFVDVDSNDEYNKLRSTFRAGVDKLFTEKIIQNIIAQPPVTSKIVVEAFYFDPNLWSARLISNENCEAMVFKREDTEVMIGSVQSVSSSAVCRENSENAFAGLKKIFKKALFPLNSIIRKWNYIENILGFDGDKQRYQEFNNVRSYYYGNSFEEKGYPAATGIGMKRGGIILEFVAVKSKNIVTNPIDNPEQVAAHHYSDEVLVGESCMIKTTPKFERARYFELFDNKLIFISGTASIIGEHTVGVNDPVKQTEITIQNINRLYSKKVLEHISGNNLQPKYGHARVYVKNKKDYSVIKKTFESHFGNLPVVYIVADICRNDLLVEIEGKVILG